MRHRRFAALLTLLAGTAVCQTPANKPAFDIADVHATPRSEWVKSVYPMQGGYLAGDRYELHRATMLDLIHLAYNVDAAKISGGPSWLDYDRFEIVAKTKRGTRADTLRLMLQTLLADRFGLDVKAETRPAQAYLLTRTKGELKLRALGGYSDVSGGCQNLRPAFEGTTVIQTIQCRNVTMDAFAQFVAGRLRGIPVVNMTGLDGSWDADVRIATPAPSPDAPPTNGFAETLEKLGLKVELGTAPQPVLAVEHVNEQPSANPSGVSESLPPLPSPEFEVATLKLCTDNATMSPRFEPGGRITATCMPVMSLVQQAWNLRVPIGENPPGTPKSLIGGTKSLVSIAAKAPAGIAPDPAHSADARDILNSMLRALLVDRYGMKVHYEERTVDAPTLVAMKPKLSKADPTARTGCARETQQTDGPIVINRDTRLQVKLVCTNITMAQFAEQMEAYDPQLAYPVLDATGIEGAWDFSISFDPVAGLLERLPLFAGRGGAGADGQASEPSGALSFTDALSKQLGLKVEMRKRPEKVFVIDHMDEKPAEN